MFSLSTVVDVKMSDLNSTAAAEVQENDTNLHTEWQPIQPGRSQCWNHFQKHATQQKCRCKHCLKVFSTPGFTTQTLARHIKRCPMMPSHSVSDTSQNISQSTKELVGKLVGLGLSFSQIAGLKKHCPEITRLPSTESDIRNVFGEAAKDIKVLTQNKISELLEKNIDLVCLWTNVRYLETENF